MLPATVPSLIVPSPLPFGPVVRLARLTAVALTAAALLIGCTTDGGVGSLFFSSGPERELSFDGPADDALLGADDVAGLVIEVTASSSDPDEPPAIDDLRLHLDGEDRTDEAEVTDTTLTWRPGDLEEGERHLAVVSAPDAGGDDEGTDDDAGEPEAPELLHEWRVTVDTTPPEVELTSPDGVIVGDDPVTVAGVTEPDVVVRIGDAEVTADEDGAFSHELDAVGDDGLELTATDPAGNTTTLEHAVAHVPSRVESDEVRAVHVSFHGWLSLREPILEMIDAGEINAVQLDIKDEAGEIGYDSEVPIAEKIGASLGLWDLEEAVAELHALDVPVIGRIVAFADPVLVNWAWGNDERDWVIQDADGGPYTGRYDGFSNFAHEDVIAYNIDVAEEAARAGVDHILWDYLRRPDGSLENMVFPGLEGTPEEGVVEFTRRADERLAPYGIEHGASLYGIAADRPTQIGQDVPALAEHLDYVAPMIYPSHWGPGEYGVEDPNRQPYDIISATLEVWQETVEGSRARIVPWLEDTRFRAWDREHQIREQIRATYDAGIDEWLMWDPHVDYTRSAYDPR